MAGVTVCTGWHPPAWSEYAARFVETFARHWPASVGLVAYAEEATPLARGEGRLLWDIPGARGFIDRHRDTPVYNGRAATAGWGPKDRGRGYSYRYDAVRFFKQCIIPAHAASGRPDGDALVWLDADVVTFANVSVGLIDQMLGGSDLCYLGRKREGSEIGFWAVRLNNRSRAFLADLASLYLDDRVFRLPQYHSAFAFDHARAAAEQNGMIARDLTPGGQGHVWMQCAPLMKVCDHTKGPRKALGHSPEHPLRWWTRGAA